ncbi:MAG TPA: bifunctional diaminohydroxyphosphoribosylaminopyrimidine deaminase/5-amino-6-(5-phosphoribosylamino)uracil reductase RibD [Flavobacteriales bacterium]|jgi:diaminohydroxyphosphoribosylaminopyrimidine deaminase/5-amino-6-(5-phosphoribosylamino)uracil reductase|nr:bifunctional diaminohydroxyphosphoribosylaminopyrimidine deaminase/5-amino-6-(5-phosphoribosylamino)uracil reductase RibD [Flavobacteriales bacterium]
MALGKCDTFEQIMNCRGDISNDGQYMRRCLELASLGHSTVSPNPQVGCVLVHNDRIIGEGFHMKAGEPHAEVLAIDSVKDHSLLKECSLYVNLEPCNHTGKTPPCTELILEKSIPRVVIGCIDSHSKVCGSGFTKLRENGVKVVVGVLEKESKEINKKFLTYHEKKRSYILLKWAESADGYLDKHRHQNEPPEKISSTITDIYTHKMRTEYDAILVGYNTVKKDNPSLTTRRFPGKNPLRIILDPESELTSELKVLSDDLPTVVFTKRVEKEEQKVEHIAVGEDFAIPRILDHLYQREIQSLIVEGGAKTLQDFINLEMWDEALIIRGFKNLSAGVKAPQISSKTQASLVLGTDQICKLTNNE